MIPVTTGNKHRVNLNKKGNSFESMIHFIVLHFGSVDHISINRARFSICFAANAFRNTCVRSISDAQDFTIAFDEHNKAG
jgi:hypothetical protein